MIKTLRCGALSATLLRRIIVVTPAYSGVHYQHNPTLARLGSSRLGSAPETSFSFSRDGQESLTRLH
jgi:hypothetical protein